MGKQRLNKKDRVKMAGKKCNCQIFVRTGNHKKKFLGRKTKEDLKRIGAK